MIDTLVRYGLKHPVIRVQNSSWLVVGMIGPNWWHLAQERQTPPPAFYDPDKPLALEIHLDADDPFHEFLDAGSWEIYPNARKLADWYNSPHRKSQRLRDRRSTEWSKQDSERVINEAVARDALELQALILADRSEAHIVGNLEYYPDGHKVRGPQVWRNGSFWVRLTIES